MGAQIRFCDSVRRMDQPDQGKHFSSNEGRSAKNAGSKSHCIDGRKRSVEFGGCGFSGVDSGQKGHEKLAASGTRPEIPVIDLSDDEEELAGGEANDRKTSNGPKSAEVVSETMLRIANEDETGSETSEEIAIVSDSTDLASLDDAAKARLSQFNFAYPKSPVKIRSNGPKSAEVVSETMLRIANEDETGSETSEEIAIVSDSTDLASLDDAAKARCEDRLRRLYEVFRHVGPSMVVSSNDFGDQVCDFNFIDNFQTGNMTFDEERISRAVVLYHMEKLNVSAVADAMNITDFDVIVHLLDHVWKERDKTVERFSLVGVARHIRIDRAALPWAASLIAKPNELTPSQLILNTLQEPVEVIFIVTALLARMYQWAVAEDLDSSWEMIENAPPPNADECITNYSQLRVVFEETASEMQRTRVAELTNAEPISTTATDISNICDEILRALAIIKQGIGSLPSARTTTAPTILPPGWERRADRLQEAQCKHPPTEVDQLDKGSVSGPSSQDKVQKTSSEMPKLVPGGEEISVVETRQSEFSCPGQMLVDDPIELADIPNGSVCLARQRNGLNFIRCQIMHRLSNREYTVRFTDGKEEKVDISRIARRIVGWLRIWEGVRVCALYEPKLAGDHFQKAFYSGIVAVGLHGYTNNEMLIFFDNGCDAMVAARTVCVLAEQQYVALPDGRTVIDRRRNYTLMPKARQLFVKHYLNRYPDWPLVPMKRKENTQRVNVTRDGVPYSAYVLQTERQFALLRFPPKKKMPGADCVMVGCTRHHHIDEWVYRGSDRLDTIRQTIEIRERAERQQQKSVILNPLQSRREARLMHNFEYAVPLNKGAPREPLGTIHETRLVSDTDLCARGRALFNADETADVTDETTFHRRQTARKSSVPAPLFEDVSRLHHSASASDTRSLRRLKDKNLVWHPISDWAKLQQKAHSLCSVDCLQEHETDPNDLTFRGLSPYMIPLMSGWRRLRVRLSKKSRKHELTVIKYVTPCGISMYDMAQILDYLKVTCSRLTVDLFTFEKDVRPNVVYKSPRNAKLMDDFSKGYEAVPIIVSNEIDYERPPSIEYDPRRYPFNKDTDVFTISKEFCSGCSCSDDCANESKCECRQLTRIEISRLAKSLQPLTVRGYDYRHLAACNDDEVVFSGIYECNDACTCDKNKCLNRVVQLGIRLPLELFKTPKVGWGVRTLVDVPAGTFICTYAGAILTDGQAEECGKMYGDEYFADVDLVDVVEKQKQNAGVDISEDYFSDEDDDERDSRSNEDSRSSAPPSDNEAEDTDYYSGQESYGSDSGGEMAPVIGKRPRGRPRRTLNRGEEGSESNHEAPLDTNADDTLRADLAFASTSLFIAAGNEEREDTVGVSSKQNEDEESGNSATNVTPSGRFSMVSYVESQKLPSLFTIDAKRKGNIGRFFNHSCEPNMRTYHVYVDTHDFRLPWIAFFTNKYVSAGTELCWDYGYTVGAVAGKKMRCHCGSRNCRKRLL
ncbi:putative histone-lysine N-methyltransferase met-2 [Toxocara canis]|uniref:Putative histone-lysine N-methyltransferase met-2 n=1 Tax=Toxocara canis TaxID=6265 RepID=A0A0B2VFF3_TOXCA|nr:putative histone-lysine N-methyltransferase met-2 [Toxocara canis]